MKRSQCLSDMKIMIAEALKSQSDLEPDIRKAEPRLSSYLAEKLTYYVHHFVHPLDPEDEFIETGPGCQHRRTE